MSTPDAGRAALPRAEGPSEIPPTLAKELVTRLARAVQRATIYPPAHPSIRLASTPLVESLRRLPCPEVLIGFTSDRVFVGASHREAAPFELPWMSARLSARGLSSLRIGTQMALEEVERLIVWLAAGDDLLACDELPSFEGAAIARVDFAAMRFREGPADSGGEETPADIAWQAMSQALTVDWRGSGLGAGSLDPVELARLVREEIERHEGTGVRAIGDRLVAVGTQLAALPEDVQAAVKGRLASFVAALSPELRGQLLTASPADDPAKLALLGGVVDRLPNALVLEMIQGAALIRGSSSGQFVSFMLKLASLAASDPQLAEAFECRCDAVGLPRGSAYCPPEQLRGVLTDLLESRSDDVLGVAPEDYQRRLEQIAAPGPIAVHGYDTARHASATDAAELAGQSARIALLLFRASEMEAADQVACLDRLLGALPRARDAWELDLLAGTVETALRLSQRKPLPADVEQRVAVVSSRFEEPSMLDAVAEHILVAGDDPPADLVSLVRAGGMGLAGRLLTSLIHPAPREGRARWARALGWLPADVLQGALAEVHRKAPRRARHLLAALIEGGPSAPIVEAALLFMADDDPALRADAFGVLFAALAGTPRWDVVVRRGLEDPEPGVQLLAIDEAGRRPRGGVRLLSGFVDRRGPAHAPEPLERAVRTLVAIENREAHEILLSALASRRMRFDTASRRVAACIAGVLAEGGDRSDAAAARAWWRSPAGLLTRVLGTGGGA